MFYDCKKLETAPELPATTLASSCYYSMFYGCTNLKTVSDLPAETLKDNCYCGMFFGCTNLEVAPKLPAKTLADRCYYYMFSGCDNLSSVTMLALSEQITNTPDYFNKWLDGAGTRAASRTLKVKDADAYNALVSTSVLPENWQKGQCTVKNESGTTIE